MYQLLSVIVFFLIFIQIQAQDYRVTLSNLTAYKASAQIRDAGNVGNDLFVIISNRNVYLLNIYDKVSLQLKSTQVFKDNKCVNSNCIDKHFDYVKTLFLNNNVVMLFQTFERTSNNLQLYAQRINPNGTFKGKLEMIDEIESKNRSNAGNFGIWPSEDSSKFVIIDTPPFEKYNGEKFGFKIYDSKLANMANFSIALPYKDKDLSLIDYFIGNDSKIHLLSNIELERDKRKAGQALNFYSVFTIDPADKSVSEYKIDLPSRSVQDASIKIDNKNHKFICCGFYSDLKSTAKVGKDIDGFYFMKVDMETKKVETQGVRAIDKGMIAQLINKKKVKEKQGIAKSFQIKDMETLSDGSTNLIAEKRQDIVWTVTSCNPNGYCSTTYNYLYYRDNIFVIHIAPDGSVKSFIDIPKKQASSNDDGRFLSFFTFKKGDRTIFIYNDNPINLSSNIKTIKDVKLMQNTAKAVVVAAEINKDGSYSKVKLLSNAYKKLALLPENAIRIGDGQYIVPTMVPPSAFSCSCFALFSKTKLGIAKIEL